MEIRMRQSQMKRAIELFPEFSKHFRALIPKFSYRENEMIAFDHEVISESDLDLLYKFSDKEREENPKVVNGLRQKLAILKSMEEKVDSQPIKRLDSLELALTATLKKNFIRGWIFSTDGSGRLMPYLVTSVKYHPARKERNHHYPAHVDVSFVYISKHSNESGSISFHSADLEGKSTVRDLLKDKDYYLETPSLIEEYDFHFASFKEMAQMHNRQFLGQGRAAIAESHSWRSNWETLDKDGVKARLVNDELEFSQSRSSREEKIVRFTHPIHYILNSLGEVKSDDDGGDDEIEESKYKIGVLPEHGYVYMYNLEIDEHMWVHVTNLEVYKYNPDLRNKIVLPQAEQQIIEILTSDVANNIEDIIAGKSGGTIILAQGLPGTGKTLTAEVYAEVIQRPLYKVRSYALGLDIESVEKNLTYILARAQRWGAVLLMDEVDIYVRSRGEDLQQNAIVGVFLRLLEYYRGLLIMTTNQGTEIDDAIVSRATAVLQYGVFDEESAIRAWTILSEQFKVRLSKNLINQLAKKYPNVSGRSIKGILKLVSKYVGNTGQEMSLEVFDHCAKFLPYFSNKQNS